MEQPANSSCFWLGLCLVVRYSIDFLSSVPLPFLCRYAPVLSIHSLREGRERGGWGGRGWCLCDDTDPIRSHGKGMEREVARRQRGIEFARLRLQDEHWIWFLCYTSICYYISRRLRVSAFSYRSITCVGLCARVCMHKCVSARNLNLCCWCLPAIFFLFFLGLNPSGESCSALCQSCPEPTLPPLPALPPLLPSLPPALFFFNNIVKSNTRSVFIWKKFVEPPSRTAVVQIM